ncbi:hypothetical protein SBF1_7740002 [Candidatus Desulfosporosinus infrequens]|uniref:Uncharacterized protein n=1 Tax=Candidatus Desulfosporosinus infrequens TaxID=2043169 RepID=A0A2U3LRM5_9FIRM|nr:hypothetical protein SBF1_7740002 [Candidatus Desulfosporosinus infrequens]
MIGYKQVTSVSFSWYILYFEHFMILLFHKMLLEGMIYIVVNTYAVDALRGM